MNKKTKQLFVLSLLLTLLLPVACNRSQEVEDTRPKVALVLKTLNNPFFITLQQGAQEEADKQGLNLIVQAAERELDVEKQMQIVENLIQAQVKAILISPSGSKEILPSIAKANAAGIPVLIVDTRIDREAAKEAGVTTETFIGSDNYEGGRVAGEFVVRGRAGETKIAILEGIAGHETGDSRLRGFMDAVSGVKGIEIVASQPANFERDQGFNVTQNILQAHPEVTVLFACNDMMALGAVEAIAAAGRTGEISVIGFDAVDDARKAIKEGTMVASVAQSPSMIGKVAVENAAKVLNGETIPSDIPVAIELITRAGL